LNANMLRRWVREAGVAVSGPSMKATLDAPTAPAFVQLPMPQERPALPAPTSPLPESSPPTAFVEIHRIGTSVYVTLPLSGDSAAWLREVLA
jgi:hypothetical protein